MFSVVRNLLPGFCFFFWLTATAQYRHQVSAQAQLPVGVFQQTHAAGLGGSYQWSKQRFGYLDATQQPFGWGLLGGIDGFVGKKDSEAGYTYRQGIHFNTYITAGALYNPFADMQVYLGAGPLLGIYRGGVDIGATLVGGASLQLSANWSIGPAVAVRKYRYAAALWTTMIRVGYAF